MTLFNRLLKLNGGKNIPLEDFFTEIVAHFLETHQSTLLDWIRFSGIVENHNWLNISLATQKSYKHPFKNESKRPDIVIKLSNENATGIAFIESKIGSQEGADQLRDYAIILDSLKGYKHKRLVYITRDFDPKEANIIFQNITNTEVQFIQLRWHSFYQFLLAQPETAIIREIRLFMQEHRMAQKHQFSPNDLTSLFYLPEALALIDTAMWSKALHKFNTVLGDPKTEAYRKRQAWKQISFRHRYFMSTDMPEDWSCHMGFQFQAFRPSAQKPFNPKDYPNVCLILQVSPDSGSRSEIIDGMRTIANEFGWQEYELDQRDAWSGIFLSKSLVEFLASENHIDSIENFFIKGLEQLRIIKEKYSELPWKAALIS